MSSGTVTKTNKARLMKARTPQRVGNPLSFPELSQEMHVPLQNPNRFRQKCLHKQAGRAVMG